MARSLEYLDGYRAASKDAQRLSEQKRDEASEPEFRRVVDRMRSHLGNELKRKWRAMKGDTPPGDAEA